MGLAEIRARIAQAEAAAGRPAGCVTLIAVSKTQPADRVDEVLAQGQRVFGENYVQEAQARWTDRRARHPDVALHMIGPLQSNKARLAAGFFDAIHSLDRPSLARRLAQLGDETGALPALFVQVNTGAEPQKAGVLPDQADAFVAECRRMGLPLAGAMCIPPDADDPVRHFRLLRALAERNGLAGLSMGMSADFERAIAEGATHVRVGSAIFGAREARVQA